MRYTNTAPEHIFGATYVNLKLFKWDHNRQNYVWHAQTGLNLMEFKALRDRLGYLDTLIDDVLNTSLGAKSSEDLTLSAHPTQCPDALNLK